MRLQAQFFVRPDGQVLKKARPLHGYEQRRIYERDGGVCTICGRPVKLFGGTSVSPFSLIPAAIDHIVPRSRGGQNNSENLRLTCLTCNASRGAAIGECLDTARTHTA